MERAMRRLPLALLLLLLPALVAGQMSKAVAHDSNVDTSGNKFLQREATADLRIATGQHEAQDELLEDVCPQNIALKWHAEASSAIYATPLITDLFSDGRKDIVVPAFLHNLEVFEGRDGAKVPGFEAFHHSTAHTSPLLHDVDMDGVPDILLATYDGEILFFKDTGEMAATRLTIPRLRVRRDWHVGLNPDHVDHSQPDVGIADEAAAGAADSVLHGGQQAQPQPQPQAQGGQQQQAAQGAGQQQQQGGQQQRRRRQLLEEAGGDPVGQQQQQQQDGQQQQQQAGQQQQQGGQQQGGVQAGQQQPGGVQAGQQQGGQQQQGGVPAGQQQGVEAGGVLSDEAADSFNELFGEGEDENFGDGDGMGGLALDGEEEEGAGGKEQEEEEGGELVGEGDVQKPKRPKRTRHGNRGKQERPRGMEDNHYGQHDYGGKEEDPSMHDYSHDYHHMMGRERMWDDEFFHAAPHEQDASPYVFIDAHILTTPSIADIDGDGADELVVSVSYFFDRQFYEKEENRRELGNDLDLGLYVASGIVVFDLQRRSIKWSQHLDLSTDFTSFKAYAYSAPTLADIDGDDKLEVILGTSMGFLYVFNCYGITHPGFPLQMGDIQAQVAVADINNDGKLELVAADSRGNVAAFTAAGKEVWEVHLESQIHQSPVFGDVDGDGQLEVVLATFSGHVHVLRAGTGEAVEPFPFRVFGKVMAPPLLTKLNNPKEPGMQIVLTAFDGFLYVIDAVTGCADSLDIGETSYSMVLADDLDGNGRLDLLVSTMNGNLYCIATNSAYHPLKTWTQQSVGGGSFTARWGWEGVYVTTESRRPRDVRGQALPLRFKIVDRRPPVASAAEAAAAAGKQQGALGGKEADDEAAAVAAAAKKRKAPAGRGPYKVSIMLTGVGQKEMNAGDHPVIGMADVLNGTGAFTMEIPCPRSRSTATIRVEMRDETKLVFADEFSLSFHIHFYRLLKWMIAAPFMAAAIALLAFKQDTQALPE